MKTDRGQDFTETLLSQVQWVRALARDLVRDAEDAEDLAQETVLAALESRRKPTGSLRAWLRAVLRKRLSARARSERHRRERERAVRPPADLPPPDEVVARAELVRKVATAALALDEPYRTAVLLRYFEGLEPREIAERLGIPSGRVRTRLSRGLERIRRILDRRCGDRRAWVLGLAGVLGASGFGRTGAAVGPWDSGTRPRLPAAAGRGGAWRAAAGVLALGLAVVVWRAWPGAVPRFEVPGADAPAAALLGAAPEPPGATPLPVSPLPGPADEPGGAGAGDPLGPGTPFLRGDVNDDGRVSISDAHCLSLWLYGDGAPPPCIQAADANDDGWVGGGGNCPGQILSGRGDFDAIIHGPWTDDPCGEDPCESCVDTIRPPVGIPGLDPTPDDLTCDSWTGQAGTVTDPEAEIAILDATCPGGSSALAIVKVTLSHSRRIGGYSAAIDGFPFADVLTLRLPDGVPGFGTRYCFLRDGVIRIAELANEALGLWHGPTPDYGLLPPAEDRIVAKLYLRLEPWTPAGTYPIVLLEGEMADSESGRAIVPALVAGYLTVLEDVAGDAGPLVLDEELVECEAPDPSPPEGPEDVQAEFDMALVEAPPDRIASVPVWIRANVPIEGFSFAINLSPNDGVQVERVVPMLRDARPWEVFEYRADPELPHWIVGEAVFSRTDAAAWLPAGERHHVLNLDFRVAADARDTVTLRFWDTCPDRDQPGGSRNTLRAYGRTLGPEDVTCLAHFLAEGGVVVGGTPVPFLRGDGNGDGAVSLADAVHVVRSSRLACEDAGDVDDNGGANLGDATRIADHLFPSPHGFEIPPPFPAAGTDATLDPIRCETYQVVPARTTEDSIRIGPLEVAPLETVEVPIRISVSRPLEAFQIVLRYDPATFQPLANRLQLEGSVFDGKSMLRINRVRTDVVPGHIAIGFARELVPQGTNGPSGAGLLVGKIPGLVGDGLAPGTEILLEPVFFPEGVAAAPDRLRTELVVLRRGSMEPEALIPRLEGGALRVVDGSEARFIRSDSNFDFEVNISDPIFTLGWLFLGGPEPTCQDAADADDSGKVELTDAVLTLGHLFGTGTGVPAPPYPERGRDGLPDDLPRCQEPLR